MNAREATDVPERLLRMAWESAEEWSKQSPDGPRPLSIRDMVIIQLGVDAILAELRQQMRQIGHPWECSAAVEWDNATEGGLYPYIGVNPEDLCDCPIRDMIEVLETGGTHE